MKCISCGSELPSQAEFCAKCGVRAGSAMPPLRPPAPGARAAGGPKKGMIALSIVALLAIALAGYFGWRAFRPSGKLVEAVGTPAPGGPLTESAGKVAPGGPLTSAEGVAPQKAPDPTEVIDYLKFVKDIERQRVLLSKSQLGDLLKQSDALTYAGGMADWSTNEPEQKYREVYQEFQQSLAQWSAQWQQLSAHFLGYPKPVPEPCAELRDRYYAMLGVTSTAMLRAGNSFADAMSGDTGKALETLTQMQGSGLGSASKEVGDACVAADDALAAVCDRFKLRKDFEIRDDPGGANLLGR